METVFRLEEALSGTVSRRRVVDGIRVSILGTGFYGVQGLLHLTPERVAEARSSADRVFALPREERLALEHREIGGQRGMNMTFGVRRGAVHRDLKEYWHHGPTRTPDDPMHQDIGDNIEVPQVQGFNAEMDRLHADFGKEMEVPLELLAESVGYPTDFFTTMMKGGDALLRDLIYFPFTDDTPVGTMWTGEHTDSCFATGLVPGILEDEEVDDSLEIQLPDGTWVRMPIPRDTMMINIGDFMSLMTCGRYPSTRHRVGRPRRNGIRRRSTVFFDHPRREVMLPKLDLDPQVFGEPIGDWEEVCAGYALFEVLCANQAHRGPNPYTKTGRDPNIPPLVKR